MSDLGLAQHPFLVDLEPPHFELMESCLRGRTAWKKGETILLRGDPADVCHLMIEGTIAIEIRPPGAAPKTIQTLYGGELLGWSWLFEPYLWTFDARVVSDASAYSFDAARLRAAIDDDCEFGLIIVKRVVKAIVNRLKAARLQVLDVYNR